MARKKRRRKEEDFLGPIVSGLVMLGLVFYISKHGLNFTSVPMQNPLLHLYLYLGGLIVLVLAAIGVSFFIRNYFDRLERQRLVRRQKFINDWFSMSPGDFEKFVAGVYEKDGYAAKVVGMTGDHGVDVEVAKNGKKYAIQVKQYKDKKISEGDLRGFYGSYVSQGFDGGTFVTASSYTRAARDWAKTVGMLLVDGNKLVERVDR